MSAEAELAQTILNSTISAHMRGHKVVFRGGVWRYADTLEIADDSRPCARCGRHPLPDGEDACLGHIPGLLSACCGHGVSKPIAIASKDTGKGI